MKKYYIDFSEITEELEQFFINHGAEVYEAAGMPEYNRNYNNYEKTGTDVYFGGNKIHFYPGTTHARVWFDDTNKGSGLIAILMYRKLIFKHTIPKE